MIKRVNTDLYWLSCPSKLLVPNCPPPLFLQWLVRDSTVVRTSISETWNIMSWSEGHGFEPRSSWTWGELCFYHSTLFSLHCVSRPRMELHQDHAMIELYMTHPEFYSFKWYLNLLKISGFLKQRSKTWTHTQDVFISIDVKDLIWFLQPCLGYTWKHG